MISPTIEQAKLYFEKHGWSYSNLSSRDSLGIYAHESITYTELLPTNKRVRGLNRRMVDLLLDLASVENRTEHEILREMTGCEWLEAIRFFKEHGYKS